ncbi:MAG: aminotransferase class V-fold PLP-dependent enzyme [Isosphaeraceae bacterium]
MIDLDQNATTPIDPAVIEAMRPHWLAGGNPESRHGLGRAARRAWNDCVESVARILGADPSEVVFTSGGTEANNLALLGLARPRDGAGHLVASPIEHPAVSGPIRHLEAAGFEVDRPGVGGDGLADAEVLAGAIRPETRLATLILAHNETGAIQPVGRLAELAASKGVPVHTDAIQAVGRIPVNFHGLGVATLAASAHKFHGPGGVGLLLVRRGTRLEPSLFGGGQQGGIRPGTPPVALAVGLAKALELWKEAARDREARWRQLRDRLEAGLRAAIGPDRVARHGPIEDQLRLPQTLHLGFPGIDGDVLLMQLDLSGIACSIGSACALRRGLRPAWSRWECRPGAAFIDPIQPRRPPPRPRSTRRSPDRPVPGPDRGRRQRPARRSVWRKPRPCPHPSSAMTTPSPESNPGDLAAAAELAESCRRLRAEIAKVIVGQQEVVEQLLVGLFARGHVLLIGVPGLAKTLLVRTVARILGLSFHRISSRPT